MYKFNLEPLLNHRRYQEEVLQKDLAGLKKRLTEEEHKLRVLRKKKRHFLLQFQNKQKDGRPASEIKLYFDFVDYLSKEIDGQYQRVLAAERIFNLKRQDLITAMKKRKTLDRLKEKGRHTYQQEQLKKERNLMDEVAGFQFRLKQ
jgi:flagellar FliJ protein